MISKPRIPNDPLPDNKWGRWVIYGSVGSTFQTTGKFVPHVDFRFGWSQLTPAEEVSVEKASRFGMVLVGGVLIPMSPNIAFDLSGAVDYFNLGDTDVNQGDLDTFAWGWAWGIRAGFTIKK